MATEPEIESRIENDPALREMLARAEDEEAKVQGVAAALVDLLAEGVIEEVVPGLYRKITPAT